MKLGAYQFAVSGNIRKNLKTIKKAIALAAEQKIELLVFPECALTGYPPHDIPDSRAVDFEEVDAALEEIQTLAAGNGICTVIGSITESKAPGNPHNSAVIFLPDGKREIYYKRALWGWDRDNFSGEKLDPEATVPENFSLKCGGVFQLGNVKIGVRICFEVRFPEYFRELYAQNTDLNIILFYDVADNDNVDRYDLIRSHIRTRAVENVCPILTVDTIRPYQTAPTALYDRSGGVLAELERNKEGLLVYDWEKTELTFGEQGRKEISDSFFK
ncbi:MAG: carbon-nitrogen hydrolase family protein [Acutalibacter sp.]|nr:carbon-nitrogen hydrolase family protein [Acutalibacter sp.]